MVDLVTGQCESSPAHCQCNHSNRQLFVTTQVTGGNKETTGEEKTYMWQEHIKTKTCCQSEGIAKETETIDD